MSPVSVLGMLLFISDVKQHTNKPVTKPFNHFEKSVKPRRGKTTFLQQTHKLMELVLLQETLVPSVLTDRWEAALALWMAVPSK